MSHIESDRFKIYIKCRVRIPPHLFIFFLIQTKPNLPPIYGQSPTVKALQKFPTLNHYCQTEKKKIFHYNGIKINKKRSAVFFQKQNAEKNKTHFTCISFFFTRGIIGVSIRHPVYNMADSNGYITLHSL